MKRAAGPCGSWARWVLAYIDAAPWRRFPDDEDRCFMGTPISRALSCRRPANGLWCNHHRRTGK